MSACEPRPQLPPGGGCPWCQNEGCPHCQDKAPVSDRYDEQHPETEHDGGLGSGDWLKREEVPS